MNTKNILTCALIAFSFAGVTSCNESDDIWDVKLKTEQTFDVVGATTDTIEVDFANGDEIAFQGAWNTETNWEIVIVGNESGQTDTIRGNSASLDDIIWNGNVSSGSTSYFPYSVIKTTFNITDLFGKTEGEAHSFTAGETCTITLRFPDYYGVDTCKTVVKIASAVEETFTASDYCIFGSFESTNVNTDTKYLPVYKGSCITYVNGDLAVPEGTTYCLMQGTEDGTKWYIDGGGFTYAQTSGWSQPNGLYPITVADTATTYLNFFMYGFPDYLDNTSVYIALANNTDNTEAGYNARFSVKEGWHGISVPMSVFQPAEGKTFDYDKVDKFIFALFSNGQAGDVKTAIDFLVITKKRPLFPIYGSNVE